MLRLYRRLQPDLAHHITLKPILYGGWAARLLNRPTLQAVTGLGYVFSAEDLRRRCLRLPAETGYRFALRHPHSHTVFQNPDDRALFIARNLVPERQSSVILGSGVAPERSDCLRSEITSGL